TSNWGGATTDGQDQGDFWLNSDTSAAGSYYRATTGQATYTDGNGQSLVNTPGQSVFTGDGTRVSLQQFTTSGIQAPPQLYISTLVTLEAGSPDILFGLASSSTGTSADRPFQFGFTGGNTLTAVGWDGINSSSTVTGSIYGPGTYLLVARAAETTGDGDTLDIWVNPLLGDEVGSGAATLSLSGGGFYVDLASTWSIDGFVVDSQGTGSITFDEIRVGESFADVTPAIPEPSTLVLSLVSLITLGGARLLRRGRSE
nr:hypothetical protein [Kiritimatiellia bacterium]